MNLCIQNDSSQLPDPSILLNLVSSIGPDDAFPEIDQSLNKSVQTLLKKCGDIDSEEQFTPHSYIVIESRTDPATQRIYSVAFPCHKSVGHGSLKEAFLTEPIFLPPKLFKNRGCPSSPQMEKNDLRSSITLARRLNKHP
jgi:hypothetical protein